MKNQFPVEPERLKALHDLEILDTPYEKSYDDLVELTARICEVPISLITLVSETRQWFKAKTGLEVTETERSVSFCTHALTQNDVFVVNDATKDSRFAENAMVIGAPHIRFYAGAPIVSPSGFKLGTLCIIDDKPKDLTWQQASALKTLSAQVSRHIELQAKDKAIKELQNKLISKEKIITKIRQDKQRGSHLCQLELDNLTVFYNDELKVLQTGKFTKKL